MHESAYLLMAWGGKALKEDERSFKNEIDRTKIRLSDVGIEYLDERALNRFETRTCVSCSVTSVVQRSLGNGNPRDRSLNCQSLRRQKMAMRYEVVV